MALAIWPQYLFPFNFQPLIVQEHGFLAPQQILLRKAMFCFGTGIDPYLSW